MKELYGFMNSYKHVNGCYGVSEDFLAFTGLCKAYGVWGLVLGHDLSQRVQRYCNDGLRHQKTILHHGFVDLLAQCSIHGAF